MEPVSHTAVNWNEAPNFINADSKHLYCRYWQPAENPENPKALIFINHGVGEHSRWYAPFADLLVVQGFLVCAHDHVGHGLSEGDRVHVNDFQIYIRDLMQHVEIMLDKHPNLPVFLIGHSMGGTIALQAGLDHPASFKGIVLIAPAIVPNPVSATWAKVTAAKCLAWLFPQFQIGPIDNEWISRDGTIRALYDEDPLVWHGGLKARWVVTMLHTLAKAQTRLGEIRWPFLLLHGDQDRLCELSGSQLMYDKAASHDKTLKIFEGGFHQLHNEPNGMGEESKKMMVDWLVKRYLQL